MFRQKSAGGTVSGLRRWCKGLTSTDKRELIAADMSDLIVARFKKIHDDAIIIREEEDEKRCELLAKASRLTLESNWLELKTLSKILHPNNDYDGERKGIGKMITCGGMLRFIAKFSNPLHDYVQPCFNKSTVHAVRVGKTHSEQFKTYGELKEFEKRSWLSKFSKIRRAMKKRESQLKLDLRFDIYDAEFGVLSPYNSKKLRGIIHSLNIHELYTILYLLTAIHTMLKLDFLNDLLAIEATLSDGDVVRRSKFVEENLGYIVCQDTINVEVGEFDLNVFGLNKQQTRDLVKQFGINIL